MTNCNYTENFVRDTCCTTNPESCRVTLMTSEGSKIYEYKSPWGNKVNTLTSSNDKRLVVQSEYRLDCCGAGWKTTQSEFIPLGTTIDGRKLYIKSSKYPTTDEYYTKKIDRRLGELLAIWSP